MGVGAAAGLLGNPGNPATDIATPNTANTAANTATNSAGSNAASNTGSATGFIEKLLCIVKKFQVSFIINTIANLSSGNFWADLVLQAANTGLALTSNLLGRPVQNNGNAVSNSGATNTAGSNNAGSG